MGPAELNTRRYYQTVISLFVLILYLRMFDIMVFEIRGLKIDAGLSFDTFKTVAMDHLNKVGYTGDKKELIVLGWILYAW